MLLYALVFLALSISVARADLACLAWDIFVPIIGLVCHFQPKVYDAVSDATIKSVEEAVTRLKDLVKFELVHKSAVVRFNYAKSTDELGFGPPNNYVGNVAKDFGDVTIGFGKEGANQLIQLYDVTHWNEVSFCLMMGAAQVVTGLSTNGRERAQTFSLSNEQDFASRILAAAPDIRELATRCINDKVSHGLAFNVTGTSLRKLSRAEPLMSMAVHRSKPERLFDHFRYLRIFHSRRRGGESGCGNHGHRRHRYSGERRYHQDSEEGRRRSYRATLYGRDGSEVSGQCHSRSGVEGLVLYHLSTTQRGHRRQRRFPRSPDEASRALRI